MSDLKKASTETINGLARYCDHSGMSVDEYTQIQITNEAKKHATDPHSSMYLKAVDKHGNDISQEVLECILSQEYELEDLRDRYEQLNKDHTKIWNDYLKLKEHYDSIMNRICFDQEGGIHEL